MYSCKRCGHNTKTKYNLLSHLNKKNECDPSIENIDCEVLRLELAPAKTDISCKICGKCFTFKTNMYRHTMTCKEMKNNAHLLAEIKELKAEIKFMKRNPAIINNNIVINIFGCSENTGYITHNMKKECIIERKITNLLEELYFNPMHPENRSLRIRNINKKTIECYNEGQWVIDDTSETLMQCIRTCDNILLPFYLEHKAEIHHDMSGHFTDYECIRQKQFTKEWFEKIEDVNEKVINSLKNEILVCLIKNKQIRQ